MPSRALIAVSVMASVARAEPRTYVAASVVHGAEEESAVATGGALEAGRQITVRAPVWAHAAASMAALAGEGRSVLRAGGGAEVRSCVRWRAMWCGFGGLDVGLRHVDRKYPGPFTRAYYGARAGIDVGSRRVMMRLAAEADRSHMATGDEDYDVRPWQVQLGLAVPL